MKSTWTLVGLLLVGLLAALALASHNSLSKPQMVDGKHSYTSKKQHDKMYHDFGRYQDWNEDWSDEDMQQHPIDEAPRKVPSPLSACSWKAFEPA